MCKPDQEWMVEQAKEFIRHSKAEKLPCKILMHDNDDKYSQPFLDAFKDKKIETRRTAIRSPNTVAFVERFVQTIKQECIDHFIVFGEKHMSLLCSEFREHYHLERPHQGLENKRPTHMTTEESGKLPESADTIRLSDIRCKERLGGLLRSYSRKAA